MAQDLHDMHTSGTGNAPAGGAPSESSEHRTAPATTAAAASMQGVVPPRAAQRPAPPAAPGKGGGSAGSAQGEKEEKKATREGERLAAMKSTLFQGPAVQKSEALPPDPFEVKGASPTDPSLSAHAAQLRQSASSREGVPAAAPAALSVPAAAPPAAEPSGKEAQAPDLVRPPEKTMKQNAAPTPLDTPVPLSRASAPEDLQAAPAAPLVHRPNPLAPAAGDAAAPESAPAPGNAAQAQAFFDTVTWHARNQQALATPLPAAVTESALSSSPSAPHAPPSVPASQDTAAPAYQGSARAGITFETPTPQDAPPAAEPRAGAKAAPASPQASPSVPSSPEAPAPAGRAAPQAAATAPFPAALPARKEAAPAQSPAAPSPAILNPRTITPPSPQEEPPTALRPIRTYQSDIATTVQQNQTSVVDIVSAEQQKKEPALPSAVRGGFGLYIKIALTGLFLGMATASGIGVYVFLQKDTLLPPLQYIPELIFSNENTQVDITDLERRDLMAVLQRAKDGTRLRPGAINNLYLTLTEPSPEGGELVRLVTATEFLSRLEVRAPVAFMRNLEDTFMLGAHSLSRNEPFLLLRVKNFEVAFAGMLEWEKDLNADLAPLFGPARIVIPLEQSKEGAATTTDDFFSSPFEDAVIANKEVRLLRDEKGKPVFLYSFLDRTTLAITTNETTFKEIVLRFTSRRF